MIITVAVLGGINMNVYILTAGYHYECDSLEGFFSSFELAKKYLGIKWPGYIVLGESAGGGYYKHGFSVDMCIYAEEVDSKLKDISDGIL